MPGCVGSACVGAYVGAGEPVIDDIARIVRDKAEAGMAYDQMLAPGNAEGAAAITAGVDALVAQTRSIERAVAALGLDKIAFEDMLELASQGAKVLQVRSVELAMVHKVRTFVRSSFEDPDAPGMGDFDNPPGTLICDEDEIVEQQVVTGIAYAKDEAQISLRRVEDRPGIAAAIFGGGYWLKASYGISISKYTSGTVEPTGFEWPLFLLWALGGAALGAALMGWSAYRRRRN